MSWRSNSPGPRLAGRPLTPEQLRILTAALAAAFEGSERVQRLARDVPDLLPVFDELLLPASRSPRPMTCRLLPDAEQEVFLGLLAIAPRDSAAAAQLARFLRLLLEDRLWLIEKWTAS